MAKVESQSELKIEYMQPR